jgi:hypothetical protein
MKEISAQPIFLQLGLCDNVAHLKEANRTIKGSMIPLSAKVLIYATSRAKEERNTKGSFPQDRKLYTVQYQKIPETRINFITECSQIFVEAEQLFSKTRKGDVPDKVLQVSQQYQKQLLRMSRENVDNEAALFSALHSIWQLVQITCFDLKNYSSALGSLSEWIRVNFTADLVELFETVTKSADPTTHPKFWKIVYECTMRSYFEPVHQLLVHLKSDALISKIILDLTLKYPKSDAFPTNSAFKQAWYKWHQDALFALENIHVIGASLTNYEQFVKLFSILAGVEDVIINETDDWHNSLMGLLHFVSPTQDVRTLSELTNLLRNASIEENILDQIQLALLEQDLGFVVGLCSQFDFWLATHLICLMEKMNILELDKSFDANSIREWYLQSFAEYILSEPKLRFVALEYFLACSVTGKESLSDVIPRISLDSKEEIDKMIQFCKTNGLKDALKDILNIFGKQSLDLKEYQDAILFYLQADELVKIGFIIEKLLKKYELDGDETFKLVASGLPTSSLFKSPALAFLSRYNEFRNLYQHQKYKEAGELVFLLLSSGSVPRVFWKMLLLDTLPLLEGQLAVFSTDQVMELMRCVEQCSMDEYCKGSKAAQSSDETFSVLKMALARSLAASMV